MVSKLGPLAPERSEVFLEHAKHLGLLAETYALTETGAILKQLLLQYDPRIRDGGPTPNPMNVRCRLAVQVIYLWSLLENDALTPFLLRELLSSRKNDAELLRRAATGLLDAFARGASIDAALELRRLREYVERVGKGEKIHRHHVRPRLEHYVDLGLIARRSASHDAETVYETGPATVRALEALAPLLQDPRVVRRFLDTRFFGAVAAVLGVPASTTLDWREVLPDVARGFELVGREIGFTPGRTIAIAACLLALESGHIVEVDQVFEAIRSAAASPLGEHLVFSGGSRLDREFLIRVLPEFMTALAASAKSSANDA
jgi:hypothetical protein